MPEPTLQYTKDPTTGIRRSVRPITHLSDFVDHAVDRFCRPRTAHFPRSPILFRGQRIGRYPLLPKIARDDLYTYKYAGEFPQNQGPRNERYMLDQFKRLTPPLLDMRYAPANDYEWLAVARHHGMATRLLDWTENALAALWFAVNERTEKEDDAVVWLFRVADRDIISEKELAKRGNDPLSVATARVYQPLHLAPRIRAQAGWFTVHPAPKEHCRSSLSSTTPCPRERFGGST